MAKINFNSIFDAISLALHGAFPEADIHGGKVEQALNEGDFNVLPAGATHTEESAVRAKREISFDVIYYPTASGGMAECMEICDALTEVLSTVTTPEGDVVHAGSFECKMDDESGNLHLAVSYPHFVYRAREQEEAMSEIRFV